MHYIDFHTHNAAPQRGTVKVINLESPLAECLPSGIYSAGIHPWLLEDLSGADVENMLEHIRQRTASGQLAAVGECGLDRKISVDLTTQMEIFEVQAEIAVASGLPLIVHCVRCYPEIIASAGRKRTAAPWIIHGFNTNRQILEQLVKHEIYLSFGPGILNNPDRSLLLKAVPFEYLLLETDDSGVDIIELYGKAARILDISEDELCRLMKINFSRIFKQQ